MSRTDFQLFKAIADDRLRTIRAKADAARKSGR